MFALATLALASALVPTSAETVASRHAATIYVPTQAMTTIVAPARSSGRIIDARIAAGQSGAQTALQRDIDWNQAHRSDRAKRTDRLELTADDRVCAMSLLTLSERSCILSHGD